MNTMLSCFSSLLVAGLSAAGPLQSQRQPLPGLPIVSPPTQHPALAGPLLLRHGAGTRAASSEPAPEPVTRGVKIRGKELKAAVKKVAALPWRKLTSAKAESKRAGRPILLLQTLGKLDGFA